LVINMYEALDYAELITGLNLASCLLALTVYLARKSRRRVAQLEQAAFLLEQHGDQLERFLSDRGAPDDLKAVLISFSDALADRKVAGTLAKTLCRPVPHTSPMTEETNSLLAALEQLRSRRPDLADAFFGTIGSGMAGAFLRWDEPARNVEFMAVRILADPRNEVAAAAEGARLRSGIRFGMRSSAAMA
jgi:hypothetical protein